MVHLPVRSHRSRSVAAFTLVELLVATTVTLLLILALAQAFAVVSDTVSNNRSMLELAGQLRGTAARLQTDLDGIASPVVPFQASGAAKGYVEYGDGPAHDLSFYPADSSLGDHDDYLMFTAENVDVPFSGRYSPTPLSGTTNSVMIHSHQAEVAWWTRVNDLDGDATLDAGESLTIYRRVMLIRPDLNGSIGYFMELPNSTPAGWYNTTNTTQMHLDLEAVNNEIDVSWHVNPIVNGNQVKLQLVANSMQDLAFRQNRFAHDPQYSYKGLPLTPSTPVRPYYFVDTFSSVWLRQYAKSGERIGEDVMLTNALAFDVRAYDPLAAISVHPGVDNGWGLAGVDDNNSGGADDVGEAGWPGSDDEAVGPGDLSYGSATMGSGVNTTILQVASGAYVDLNYLNKYGLTSSQIPASSFRNNGGVSGTACIVAPLYDTWTLDYEGDQIDQDGDGLVDEAIDGFDNNSIYGADDAQERETSPPYPVDLRGLQVRLRAIDRDTRQVRQSTITADYTTE